MFSSWNVASGCILFTNSPEWHLYCCSAPDHSIFWRQHCCLKCEVNGASLVSRLRANLGGNSDCFCITWVDCLSLWLPGDPWKDKQNQQALDSLSSWNSVGIPWNLLASLGKLPRHCTIWRFILFKGVVLFVIWQSHTLEGWPAS